MLDKDINLLIKILEESNINELEVSTFWGRQKIRLQKHSTFNHQNIEDSNKIPVHNIVDNSTTQNQSLKTESDEVIITEPAESLIEKEPATSTDNTITIKAPLVGTFYISPKPDAPPYISEGDEIKQGQIICIIEAMKIFNEIESEYSGKIIKLLVGDATPVEYDQDLLVISPD